MRMSILVGTRKNKVFSIETIGNILEDLYASRVYPIVLSSRRRIHFDYKEDLVQ